MITIIIIMIGVNIKTHFLTIIIIIIFHNNKFCSICIFILFIYYIYLLFCGCCGVLVAESLRHAVCDCASCNVIVLLCCIMFFYVAPLNTPPHPL